MLTAAAAIVYAAVALACALACALSVAFHAIGADAPAAPPVALDPWTDVLACLDDAPARRCVQPGEAPALTAPAGDRASRGLPRGIAAPPPPVAALCAPRPARCAPPRPRPAPRPRDARGRYVPRHVAA